MQPPLLPSNSIQSRPRILLTVCRATCVATLAWSALLAAAKEESVELAVPDQVAGGGGDTPAAPKAGSPASHPPRVLHTVSPVHPPALRKKLIGGECEVECLVSDTGHVVNTKVLSASLPEFGEAAETALRQWEFAPGERDGKPIAMTVRIPFDFSFTPAQILEIVAGRPVFRKVDEQVFPAEQLPNWPRPYQIPLPPYPAELKGTGKHGKAVISIVIDQDGHVINPKVVKTTYPEFAMPAMATAVRLAFPPQTVANKPGQRIYVSMDIEYDFKEGVNPSSASRDVKTTAPAPRKKSESD